MVVLFLTVRSLQFAVYSLQFAVCSLQFAVMTYDLRLIHPV
jgi:hypothetical protein